MKTPKWPSIILAAFFLSACDPVTLSLISNGIDVISWAATDKTTKDHALSAVTEKDCKIFRALEDKDICQEKSDVALVEDDRKTHKTEKTRVLEFENRGRVN